MMRLFVAIELPAAARAALEDTVRMLARHAGARFVRWTNLQQAHLTLKFLGDTPESAVQDVERLLAGVAAGTGPLRLKLSEVGAFPDRQRPRVIWVGLEAGASLAGLHQLHTELDRGLVRLGFAPDGRPLSPHITLGRVRQGLRPADSARVSDLLAQPAPIAPVSFRVTSILLLSSLLRPEGPIHTVLFEAPLGAA